MTVFSENAAQFATRAEDYINQTRRAAAREAVELISAGRPGYARFKMTRSIMHQAKVAGLGVVPPIPCPCGTDSCDHDERAA